MNRMEFQVSSSRFQVPSFKFQVPRNKIQASRLSLFEILRLATFETCNFRLLQLLKPAAFNSNNSTLATFETCNF